MDVHIVRQPVFDMHQRTFAYELLFCQPLDPGANQVSEDRATAALLSSAFLTEGVETIVGNKPCFIHFSKNLLCHEIPVTFPKNKVIVVLRQQAPPEPEVIEACRTLADQGFAIALDGFASTRAPFTLLEFASIIKIDWSKTPVSAIERIMYPLRQFSLKYLATNIESYAALEQARKLGFSYFQGTFFAKPESLHIKEIAANKLNLLRLLTEVTGKTTTITRLEQIIEADVALSYKLLRYINSAFFSLLATVESIHQAIVYLGEREIKRFVTLVLIAELATDKPQELVRLSVVRGRFCELMAQESPLAEDAPTLFLLGLFSLIDAILDRPISDIVEGLPLPDLVTEALVAGAGPLRPYLDLMLAYERGAAPACRPLLARLRFNPVNLPAIYAQAVKFANFLT